MEDQQGEERINPKKQRKEKGRYKRKCSLTENYMVKQWGYVEKLIKKEKVEENGISTRKIK